METLWQDLRYGMRALVKNPGFTAVALITLALGIGVNTAIFSVVNAILLRPLPYKAPDRLVMIEGNFLRLDMENLGASPPEFNDYREQTHSFELMAAFNNVNFNLTGGDQPEQIVGARVSAQLFPLLGSKPMPGRSFVSEEERPGRDNVVILSHGLWKRRFNADPNIIGKTLTLDSTSYTVVGIMPPDFQFPHSSFPFAVRADLWIPLAFTDEQLQHRSSYSLRVMARLKSGVTLDQAQAEMAALARRLEEQHPRSYRGPRGEVGGWRVTVVPVREQVVGNIRPALLVLLGAVGFVLLIACANVANLLLARAVGRRREMAIRMAVGASHRQLIQQQLIESLLLAVLGGALGVLCALWGDDLLVRLNPVDIPRVQEVSVDARVVVFTFAMSLLTGLIFGVVPAMSIAQPHLSESLKEGGQKLAGGFGHNRVRHLLVVAQLALSLVMLIAAGLLIKSFVRLQQVNPGFRAENLLTMEIALPPSKYVEPHQQASFFQQLLQRVATLPGTRSAGLITILPMSGARFDGPVSVEGRPLDFTRGPEVANYRIISSGYFQAMGIPHLQGRQPTEQDAAGKTPVVVVNQTLARHFFPNENPIGRRLKLGAPQNPRPWLTIVGVVGDVKHSGLGAATRPEMYVPYLQEPAGAMTLVMRADSNPMSLAAAVRREVMSVDLDQPVYNIRTMEQVLSDSVSQRRFSMLLLGLFSVVALVLAAVGLYAVISYSVNQRTHEIGICMALGAKARDVLKLVVRQGMVLAFVGVVIGLGAALGLSRFISSLLFGVSATDPLTFVVISLLLTVVALLACYLPARRATKVDPMVALRCE